MSITEWAKAELDRIPKDGEGMQDQINKDILKIVELFAGQGHSGFSAGYALSVLRRLLDWKPITPLTGEDDEWSHVIDPSDNTEQNKRCSAVFRKVGDNSTAFYLHGKIFSDNGGKSWYHCRESRVPVTFPYMVPLDPEKVYVEPEHDEEQNS